MRRPSLPLAIVLLALSAGCSSRPSAPATTPPTTVRYPLDGVARLETANGTFEVSVQIAGDETSRERGLMGVSSLDPDDGMAFLFPDAAVRTFWMKDTLIPLSIAFFGDEGRIVTIREMTPCHADPCTLYSSGAPASGALEMNAGWFDDHGVAVGDRIVVAAE